MVANLWFRKLTVGVLLIVVCTASYSKAESKVTACVKVDNVATAKSSDMVVIGKGFSALRVDDFALAFEIGRRLLAQSTIPDVRCDAHRIILVSRR